MQNSGQASNRQARLSAKIKFLPALVLGSLGLSSQAAELLTNGGFESGATGWLSSASVICSNSTCSGGAAHGGTGFAWLDGYGTTHTDTLTHSFAVPVTATTGTVSFWLSVNTDETTTAQAYDKLTVTVSSGSALAALGTYSNLDAASGYRLKTFDISSFIAAHQGQTLTLRFTGQEDSSMQTSFLIDDVSVQAN